MGLDAVEGCDVVKEVVKAEVAHSRVVGIGKANCCFKTADLRVGVEEFFS